MDMRETWEDYIREWLRRTDFRDALPELLEGEDEDFTRYVRRLVEDEKQRVTPV